MNYKVQNGVYFLDEELSILEKKILDLCSSHLEERGFKYLSIPSLINQKTFDRQEIQLQVPILKAGEPHVLAGSAEQGLLERFTDQEVSPALYYARNQCFRNEIEYHDLFRVKEFIKVEQYCFCTSETWEERFQYLLDGATSFLRKLSISYKVVNRTHKDQGYHVKKYDIEVLTQKFGWMETHSCTYFGTQQSRRFNITGANHTISNTGIAAPRILIPFIEHQIKQINWA